MLCKCGEPLKRGFAMCSVCLVAEYERSRKETRRRLQSEHEAAQTRDPAAWFAMNVAVGMKMSVPAVKALTNALKGPEVKVPECFRGLFTE